MELTKPYINGKWVSTGKTFRSLNPATGEVFLEVEQVDEKLIEEAFSSASSFYQKWKDTTFDERENLLNGVKDVLIAKSEEIARIIAQEQGKPVSEALTVEVLPSIDALDFYINRGRLYLEELKIKYWQVLFRDKKGYYRFDPVGVVGVISPWNYPFIIPFLDIIASVFTGNTVVLKPSSTTPAIGLTIANLFHEAGAPPGLLNVLTGRSGVGEAVIKHPATRIILFTGSVETGKRVMSLASEGLKKVILELGGKDPAIVTEDVDIERAIKGITWGAFMNAGQTCASIERLYVHEKVYDVLLDGILEFTKNLKVGDPLDPDTEIGPMTTESQRMLVEAHIEDAVEKGARLIHGGKRVGDRGFFLEPAILTDVNHDMIVMRDETFGPVLPIMKFSSIEEAIQLANDSKYGLTASIWTRDESLARKIAQKLETGTVTMNDQVFSFGEPEGAWGGVKYSGIGRTHGRFGLLELTNIKFVSEDFTNRSSQLWWYPYDDELYSVAKLSVHAMYGHGKFKYLLKMMPFLGKLKKTTSLFNLLKNWKRFF